ncbi:MAG: TetR/AcrR family transcriptional regulator C-terminal domain-containing protein [Longicatena sp.]
MSTTTKRALATSLKHLLTKKPLDKITIGDICEDCEVNRQTFYYHFKNIYDLIDWIYSSEVIQAVDNNKTYSTWEEGFNRVFAYAIENKTFVLSTFHSIGFEQLEEFLYRVTYDLLIGVINEKCEEVRIREEDKVFIANFYKYAFVGVVLDWVKHGMKQDPNIIMKHIGILIEGNFLQSIERFSM